MQGMALVPFAELDELAALLGIRTWHPAAADDLAVLRELPARRTALAQPPSSFDPAPSDRGYGPLLS